MKRIIYLALALAVSGTGLLFTVNSSHADTLKAFKSDGCSAFPDGTFEQRELWLTCCIQHDYEYWQGGSYQQRLVSDQALKTCVTDVGQAEIAILMLAGVRVGGTPYLPTQFRWGYGWSYPRLYGPLSAEELKQVQKLQPLLTEIYVE
tara:strand:- start:2285 stop:2728 length:444 start_codon:yes stop_codon:yes gene_type:complete